jgi:hypothetical protein
MACYHCRRADKKTTWRGLCYTCYKDDKVRALYPKYRVSDYEPTQEELDQMIAEQLACKPSWWWKDWEKPDGEDNTVRVEPGRVVGEAVKRGRGLRVRGG